MFTCEIILVAALFAVDKEIDIEVSRPTLIALAIDSEVIDPREQFIDLKILRNRDREYASYPKMGECARFPDRKIVNDLLMANRKCRDNFSQRLTIDLVNEDVLRTAIVECDQLYQVWDTLRDAQTDFYYITVRRNSLKLLRDLIGDTSFYSGELPPHVPVWHFPRK